MNRRAVGYDIYSEPNRRAAVQKAVATGTAAMTARIILVQEDADAEISPQFGVLLVQPTFDLSQDISTPAARAGAINVLLVAAFRMGDLMDSVLARQSIVQDNGLDVRLFEAQTAHPERLLFASDTVVDGPREFTSSISLYGRDWTFQITGARVQSGAVNASSPMIILNSGILLSLLISAFLWTQSMRAREGRIAAAATQENNVHVQSLMHEVNHRSKNLLTVVRAIARLTATSDPKEFLANFSKRIEALAASQDLLARSAWKGTQIRDLVSSQLAHHEDLIGTRIFAHGPTFQMQAAAQTLGMAIHELATNAGKYGALSNDTGRVTINWQILPGANGEDRLNITWIESGGPTVVAPDHRGFGSVVLGRMAEHGLNGAARTEFGPGGLDGISVARQRRRWSRGRPHPQLPLDPRGLRGYTPLVGAFRPTHMY